MSLVHTVQWYRRHRARHPELASWPETTAIVGSDLTLAGESMAALAREGGTPCIRVAEAPRLPWGTRRGERYCAVVVAAVEAIVPAAEGADAADAAAGSERTDASAASGEPAVAAPEVWLDAELDGCEPVAQTFRMIGRPTNAATLPFVVRPRGAQGEVLSRLPADLRVGDLLVFVSARPVSLHDIRHRTRHRERLF